MTVCINCQRAPASDRLRGGRCMSCYRYWRKHGVDRPREHMIRRPGDPPPICANCHQRFAGDANRHLCNACHQYQRTRGRPRPRHLWAESCKVCGKPRQEDRRDGFSKGRCPTCRNYERRFGRRRPQTAIRKYAPHGWCDCGQPAVEVITVAVQQHAERLPVCADCLAAERADASSYDLDKARIRGRCL